MKKIVIFAPHPDDELIAAGGSMLKWREKGHNIHIIYITDGRAAYRYEKNMGRLRETEETLISEEKLAEIRLNEIDEVIEFLDIPKENIYKFKIPDQDAKNHIREGIEKSKEIIIDVNRIVLPSNNNTHEDHQATYEIATGAAKELNLDNVEFYSYALYVVNKAPMEKQIKIKMAEYRDKVHDALLKYKSQQFLENVQLSYGIIKRKRMERFGVYQLSDLGAYFNF